MSIESSLSADPVVESKKLPAIEVANHVVWVNKEVDLPFDFKIGESNKLGIFLTKNEHEATYHVEVMDNHFRSALLGKVLIKDSEHNIIYKDIDIKGLGPITYDLEVDELTPDIARNKKAVWGFYDNEVALNDANFADHFTDIGLRTYRILAVIELDEIVDTEGNKISIEEAVAKKYILPDLKPAVAIRAFGMKARIKDAISDGMENNFELLNEARSMVANELGREVEEFTMEEYMNWFAETLGKQISIIHNDGYMHHGLHNHNITLDCRIVDLDAVKKLSINDRVKMRQLKGDYDFAVKSLKQLSKAADSKVFDKLLNKFNNSYIENLNPEIRNFIENNQ